MKYKSPLDFNAELYEDCSFVGMWNHNGQLFSDSYKIKDGKLYVYFEEENQWITYEGNNDNDIVFFGLGFERFDLNTKLLDLDDVLECLEYESAVSIIKERVINGDNFNDIVQCMYERHPLATVGGTLQYLSDAGELKYEL